MRRELFPGLIGLVLLICSQTADARQSWLCWGSCEAPPIGECLTTICEERVYYMGRVFVGSCGFCDYWECDSISECLFGGGCNCWCWGNQWFDNCSVPV
jgi:hypothetical protein